MDVSLVTLEASAGSVVIKITIATESSSARVNLTTIERRVAAVDDSMLATSIGAVIGANVSVSVINMTTGTIVYEAEMSCPRGKWCTAGRVVPCARGTYNPLEDQDFATACIPCPPNSNTLSVSSMTRGDCICDTDYFDSNASVAVDLDLLVTTSANTSRSGPVIMMAAVVRCMPCMVGTACAPGSTLEALPLRKGYYRLNASSVDVRVCPDSQSNCSTTFGSSECESTSGCQGGAGFPCAATLTGVYCRLCDRSNDTTTVFYKPATADTMASCEPCSDTVSKTILLVVAVFAAAALAMLIVLWIRRRLSSDRVAYLTRIITNYTPQNKIKIILTFYQIATRVPRVYDVAFPADVASVLDNFATIVTLGLENVAMAPLECMQLEGYLPRLLFWMMFPVALTMVIVGHVVITSGWRRFKLARVTRKSWRDSTRGWSAESMETEDHHGEALLFHLQKDEEKERAQNVFEQTLHFVLLVVFMLYPKVTNVAFEGFPCFWFDAVGDVPKRGWLRTDVSIECNTPDHDAVKQVAWAAVVIYPIGLWLASLALLRKASTTILSGKTTAFSRSVTFLYQGYRVPTFWWELMEMLRKFLLVGLFVTVEPGTILQIALGTVVSAAYVMIELKAHPFESLTDDALAQAASWCLLMLFFCCVIYKYDELTASDDLQLKMSSEQMETFIVPDWVLGTLLLHSVWSSLLVAGGLVIVQVAADVSHNAQLRRLKYLDTGLWVECKPLFDPQAYHLYLSHAWPAAQDRMRAVKARLLECLPSCRTFLDVDDLKSGSGKTELDQSGCILVFCTSPYFEKRNSLKELYRVVCKGKYILAMLEPDATQQGNLDHNGVRALITNANLERFVVLPELRQDLDVELCAESTVLPHAFENMPDEDDVRTALFKIPPVEWNRLPHFQDVTIRLIAQRGVFHGKAPPSTSRRWTLTGFIGSRRAGQKRSLSVLGAPVASGSELYLEGEAAHARVSLPPPLSGRKYHLFCSSFNAGALTLAKELMDSNVFVPKGKGASAALTVTTDITKLADCDHVLVLLDARTWTSGADTAKFVEHIHKAMRIGVHICCVHELPAVVGPPRHACDFALMFNDDWTPAHLTGGATNLYKEMDLALKGKEWRQPGLVALAAKLTASAAEHSPIKVRVPKSYEPKTGANPWAEGRVAASSGSQASMRSQSLPGPRVDAQARGPHNRVSQSSEDEVELAAMTPAVSPRPTSVDIEPGSSKPLPRPRPRRRSSEVLDEIRAFGSRASCDYPPSHRISGRVKQMGQRVKPELPDESDNRSSGIVGRARGNSLAQEPSACWLAFRSSSPEPGASEAGGAQPQASEGTRSRLTV